MIVIRKKCYYLLIRANATRKFIGAFGGKYNVFPQTIEAEHLFHKSSFSWSSVRTINTSPKLMLAAESEKLTVTFKKPSGESYSVQGKVGDTLLDLVVNNEVPLDGYGACEGTLACSTCHVVLDKSSYDLLPDKPSDEELDMLDLAYGLTETAIKIYKKRKCSTSKYESLAWPQRTKSHLPQGYILDKNASLLDVGAVEVQTSEIKRKKFVYCVTPWVSNHACEELRWTCRSSA